MYRLSAIPQLYFRPGSDQESQYCKLYLVEYINVAEVFMRENLII